jgi:class 3 adenylate cyclase
VTRPHESPECRCAGCQRFDAGQAAISKEMGEMVRYMGETMVAPTTLPASYAIIAEACDRARAMLVSALNRMPDGPVALAEAIARVGDTVTGDLANYAPMVGTIDPKELDQLAESHFGRVT